MAWLLVHPQRHFNAPLRSLANAALVVIKRLAHPGAGLTPFWAHRLALSLLLPVVSYGADLFVPNITMTQKLEVFWHRVQRWVTNCSSSTPVNIFAVDAALPPIRGFLIVHKRRLTAVTLACTPLPISTAAAPLLANFPARFSLQKPSSLRPIMWRKLLTGRLPWDSLTKTRIRRRLPLDHLAHLALPYVPAAGTFPPRLSHLVPSDYTYPDIQPISWPALRARAVLTLREEWMSVPLPQYYPFVPSLVPHPFMAFPKFIARRIHQMRSGKSSLAAHYQPGARTLSYLHPQGAP